MAGAKNAPETHTLNGKGEIVNTTTPSNEKVAPVVLPVDLRDYFAAKAMQGFMANKSNPMRFDPDNDAKWAYMIADAMLAAREK